MTWAKWQFQVQELCSQNQGSSTQLQLHSGMPHTIPHTTNRLGSYGQWKGYLSRLHTEPGMPALAVVV